MATPRADRAAWLQAGGDPEQHDLLARVGQVAPFAAGDPRCFASIHPDRPSVGAIADWIGGPEVVHAAERWLAEQGCTEVRAPMWMCPWFGAGANDGPLTHEPLLFEPTEPADRWAREAYLPYAHFVSILAEHGPNVAAGMEAAAALASRGWSLQSLEFHDEYEESIRLIHDISHRAHEGVRGYTRVPLDVLQAWYRALAGLLPEESLSRVALNERGEPVGFILATAEPAAANRSWFQILSLAVLPDSRQRGLASWMVANVHEAARKAGIEAGIHAKVRLGSGPGNTTWFEGETVRRYTLFRKALT